MSSSEDLGPGSALDALVAEYVFGLAPCAGPHDEGNAPSAVPFEAETPCRICGIAGRKRYSTDAGAAHEVEEEIARRGHWAAYLAELHRVCILAGRPSSPTFDPVLAEPWIRCVAALGAVGARLV